MNDHLPSLEKIKAAQLDASSKIGAGRPKRKRNRKRSMILTNSKTASNRRRQDHLRKLKKLGRNIYKAANAEELRGIYEEKDFNPIVKMIDMVQDQKVKDREKVDLLKELANYIYPKLRQFDIQKQMEITGEVTGLAPQNTFNVQILQLPDNPDLPLDQVVKQLKKPQEEPVEVEC